MDLKTKQRLLKIREAKKRKNPSFRRVESWRYVKVKPSWRKARGIDNKTRRKTKTGVKSPEPGYRSPKGIRYLHPSGLEDVLVYHKEDLNGLSPKKHGIRIARRLGARKRSELIEYAREKGFRILNIGISREELEQLEKSLGISPEEEELDVEIEEEEEEENGEEVNGEEVNGEEEKEEGNDEESEDE